MSYGRILRSSWDGSLPCSEVIETEDCQPCNFSRKRKEKEKKKKREKKKREELKNMCQDLVYSRTEDSYDDAFAKLRQKAPEEFLKYFEENWTNCREMWVEVSRKKMQHNYGKPDYQQGWVSMRKSRHLSSPVHLFLHVSERFKFDAGKHYEASHNRVLSAVRSRYVHGVDSQLRQQVQQIATICCHHNHIWDEGELQDDHSLMHTIWA